MAYRTVTTNNVDEAAPLIYRIDVECDGKKEWYIGQSVLGSHRCRVSHIRAAEKCLRGEPFRPDNPEGYQKVHYAMAQALRAHGTLHLTLIENAELSALTDREHFHVTTTGATLNATLPRGGGPKTDRPTKKRREALAEVIKHPNWRRWKSENGQRWGAACHAYTSLNGFASKAEGERELIRELTEVRSP